MNNPYEAYRKMAKDFEGQKKKDGQVEPQQKGQSMPLDLLLKEPLQENRKEMTYGNIAKDFLINQKVNQEKKGQEEISFIPDSELVEPENKPPQKPINPYIEKSVMTATPQELTLMLYNGAIRFMKEAITHIEANNIETAHNANIRAQDIIIELMATLKTDIEISNYLYSIYVFILDTLAKANLKKEPDMIREVLTLTQELRDTWQEAMKNVKSEK